MVKSKTREGRTLMITHGIQMLMPARAGCGAGGWESRGGRKLRLVGAGDYE